MAGLEQSENWIALQQLCKSNVEYFSAYDNESSLKIKEAIAASLDQLKYFPPIYDKIVKVAPLFDFDADTPGNGYRSFIMMIDRRLEHYAQLNRQILNSRRSYFFRQSYYVKEIEASSQLIASLLTCLRHLETLYDWNEGKELLSLFTDHTPQELLSTAQNVNQYCFYGRYLGFQFCDSIRRIITFISSAMAAYSEIYYDEGRLTNKISKIVKYFTDPEERAKRIVDISHWAEVEFCHSFWMLNETDLWQFVSSLMIRQVLINHVLFIPPEELTLNTVDGLPVNVPIPTSHIGMKSIQVRLLSNIRRVGMAGKGDKGETLAERSNSLIIHCHGGGFVAQSSKSHQIYLKKWTRDLQVPILSIDYTLSLEAPYPRALEEVVYVYGWVLKHGRSMLGTTLEKIILAGDSAGANLCVGATLRCLELNLRRPDGIFMAYTPVWMEFIPSPSRLLCLTDPVLPFGFMIRCLKTYAATNEVKKSSPVKKLSHVGKTLTEEFVFQVPRDALFSPYLASNEVLAKMPPCKILSMDVDPCLDDCIMFGKKLRSLGILVTLDIIPGLVHGFLNLIGISKEANDGSEMCIKRIRELIND